METEIRHTVDGVIAGIDWYFTGDVHITDDGKEQLEDSARERIAEMIKEGYNSGELITYIDEDCFHGWWN